MEKNNFKESLKTNVVPTLSNINNATESLLKDLGLFPLPENIEVNISEDNNYLNFKLKDNNGSSDSHLLFQLALNPRDLSKLQSRSDYEELLERYHIYKNEYFDEIKNYSAQEKEFLQKQFPDLLFVIKIRTKSYESYLEKLCQNIENGKSPYINDIMAERIILLNYKKSKDNDELTKMCYEVAKALDEFRTTTDFEMKPYTESHYAKADKEYITKDYIAHPKENGYQSLHLLLQNKENTNFSYETQIRTYQMEDLSKNSIEIAHNGYKPRILNDLSATRIPLYTMIMPLGKVYKRKPYAMDISFDSCFHHFYNSGVKRNSHENDNYIPITYEHYKKELHEITETLGVSFRDIREKLRNIDTSKYVKNKDNDEFTRN